jgi:DNA-binding NtrC family response regulator
VPPTTSLRRRAEDALGTAMSLEVALQLPERRIIEAALERNAWSRVETAKELGIDRTTLYKKMRKHGLGGDRNAA